MKKFTLLFLFFVLSTVLLFAQEITYSNFRDGSGISIGLSLKSYDIAPLQYRGEQMHEITLSGIFIPNEAGMPNLPRISKVIAVPNGAVVRVSIKSMKTERLQNMNIAPALRIQAIPEEPDMNYVKNEKRYSTNEFYPQNPVEISETTKFRGINTVVVGITPFQYNPVTQELIVINNIEVEIEYIGATGEYDDPKYRSQWFDPILKNAILNYDVISDMEYRGKGAKDGTGCEYLIVLPNREDFMPLAEQIKEFRTKQGIYTKIMRLDEMGVTNTTALKAWFHNAYNTWDIPPVAVLLMGTHNTNMSIGIPAETVYHVTEGNCITDNQYASTGSNNLPDMVFGRMAAATLSDMNILVSKFLEYETQPCMDPEYYQNPITALGWQTERWFQICSEVVGGYWRKMGKTPVRINKIYQPPQNTSIWSSNQNTSMVTNYFGPGTGGTGYIPTSPNDLGGWDGGLPAHVVTAVNNGAFVLQHRDHGYDQGWGEPAFIIPHISQLTNVGKMTYLFTINCQTGKFNNPTPCFGDVFHRHTYQGQNAGCVGYVGPTEVSFSFVNDAFAWGMYDFYDPDFLPSYGYPGPGNNKIGNWMPAFGNVAGKYFLYQSSWPYNPSEKLITYQMFTAHSDVFLRLFTEVPQPIVANHAEVTPTGNPNFLISANEGALIALTAEIDGNLEILDIATATGTTQTMNIPSTLIPTTEIHVVITGQNFLRYDEVVTVVPAEGSYVIGTMELSAENTPHSGTTIFFDLTLKNVGIETATGIQINLTTESNEVILFNDATELPALVADGEEILNQIFSAEIKNYLPDETPIMFNLNIISDNNDFHKTIKVTVLAPKLELTGIAITKATGTGAIAPGDEVNIDFEVANIGHNAIADVFSTAFSYFSGFELFAHEQTIAQINAGETQHITFTGKVGDNVENGSMIPIHFYAFKGTYTTETTGYVIIGSIMEDFETGNFLKFPWVQGAYPWEITTSGVYQGTYSARSKTNLGDNNISQLKMTTYVPFESTVSYARNVSSENNYDWFSFYIDSEQKEHTSGTSNSWTMKSFPVSEGTHTFMFEYSKDQSVASGSDCAWIDNVTIPGMGVLVEEDLPHIKVMDYTVEGRIDDIIAGEAQITFDLKNIGQVNANDIIVELSCDYPIDISAENSGSNQELPFSLNINEETSVMFNLVCEAIDRSEVEYVELTLKIKIEEFGVLAYYPVVLRFACGALPELCEPPINLEGISLVVCKDGNVLLTWEKPESIDGVLLGYNMYRDGEQINEEVIEKTEYYDLTDKQENSYQVSAVYEHCESDLTAPVIVILGYGISDFSTASFQIFPNPAKNELQVTSYELRIEDVVIFDVFGRNVLSHTAHRTPYTVIDVSHLTSGMYFVKIISEQGSVIKKVVIEQ